MIIKGPLAAKAINDVVSAAKSPSVMMGAERLNNVCQLVRRKS
jgi:hypothetical protein